jgi:hypothetical protein
MRHSRDVLDDSRRRGRLPIARVNPEDVGPVGRCGQAEEKLAVESSYLVCQCSVRSAVCQCSVLAQ